MNTPAGTEPETGVVTTGKTAVLGLNYRLAGLLAYLPFLAINVVASVLWLVTEPKDNRFLRFHAMQNLLLSGGFLVLGIGIGLVTAILFAVPFLGILGFVIQFLWMLATLTFIGINIYGMVQAWKGKMTRLPYIGDIASGMIN